VRARWSTFDLRKGFAAVAAGVAVLAAGETVQAETLPDAIALAYQSNPTLQSARAQLRALDEEYVQARAGYRATLSLQVEPSYNNLRQPVPGGRAVTTDTNTGAAALQLSQPIYSGGRVASAVKAAKSDIDAGQEGLRQTEAQVILAVVQAYEDVRRDEQIFAVLNDQVAILQKQVDDARTRRSLHANTRTDVEQSEAQLEGARAQLVLQETQVQTSRAEYVAVVGQNPATLAPEPGLPGLPANPDAAFDVALSDSPVLGQAKRTEAASSARIAIARAQSLPSAALSATLGYTGDLQPFYADRYARAVTAGVVITQPLLTGGVTASGIRKATELNNSDRINIEAARRTVIQTVAQAYSAAIGDRRAAAVDVRQAEAAKHYFEDTETEYKAGQRTTLDVLVAQETLRDAEIARINAAHDAYVAEASLLGAMGHLEARRLVADIPLYDAKHSFDQVANKGWEPLEVVAEMFDNLSFGRGAVAPLPAPAADTTPVPVTGPPIPYDAPQVTASPAIPLPGTTSSKTPPRIGDPQSPAPSSSRSPPSDSETSTYAGLTASHGY
jgi:outer membrane protein